MEFRLEISLRNDAMQTGYDVAEALHSVARALETKHEYDQLDEFEAQRLGFIYDLNGNTVGSFHID